MRRSAGTEIIAVLPGNHEEFLRQYLVPSRRAIWGTRFAILSCTRRGLVYLWMGYWIVDSDLVKGLQQALPYVVHSLI